jgi:hypothetical protein
VASWVIGFYAAGFEALRLRLYAHCGQLNRPRRQEEEEEEE